MGVYQSSATDLQHPLPGCDQHFPASGHTFALQAQRNTAGAAEDDHVRWQIEAMAFTGVWMGGNAKVTGTLAVDSTLAVTGAAFLIDHCGNVLWHIHRRQGCGVERFAVLWLQFTRRESISVQFVASHAYDRWRNAGAASG